MIKKIAVILLICLQAVALFAGANAEEKVSAVHPDAGKVNVYGWTIPENTIKISYFAGKDDPDKIAADSVIMNEYLLETFNVQIEKIVYDTDRSERLNLMLVSNEYPDVIACNLNKTEYAQWVDQGRAQSLESLVDSYGPNIKSELGNYYQRYFSEDGNLYGLPRAWGGLGIPDFSAHIRWDWWNEMGAPEFSTPEEYYAILKQMVEDHPTNQYGEKTYAISWDAYAKPPQVAGVWGLNQGWKEAADHSLTYWINTQEGIDMALFYNQIYRDGLLDPDAFNNIDKYDAWKAKFSSERIAGHIGGWWQSWNAGHEVWQQTWDSWTDDNRYVQVNVKADDAEMAYLSPKNMMGWGMTVITDACENPEDVVKWFDFEITPMGTRLMGWGVPNLPNSNWNVHDDGTWSFNESAKSGILDGTFDFQEAYTLGMGRFWMVMPTQFSHEERPTTVWWDQNFNQEAKWKKIMNDNLKDTIYDGTAYQEIAFDTENPVTLIKQQIKDLELTGFANAVMSETAEECIEEFMKMRQTAMKLGLGDYEEYMTSGYINNLKNWGDL
ncbi:MAG: sugar ABC transporter substrate-binding protein [Bacteroidetes bacterium]|nr:sugar ABC transporter substrate-binding protein [Bacteroidota bacterium]